MCYRHSPLLQSITFLLCVHAKSLKLCLTLCDPVDCVACQAPLSMGFFRWEHWSGFSFPPSGDLTDRGIKLPPLMSPALAGSFFITSAPLEAHIFTLVLWRKKKEDIHVYHFIFLMWLIRIEVPHLVYPGPIHFTTLMFSFCTNSNAFASWPWDKVTINRSKTHACVRVFI